MKINCNIYPSCEQVKNLPVFLTGIGGSEYQGHIFRPKGYCWNQILFCAEGEGMLKYDGNTISLSCGEYFFLPQDYPHEYYPANCKWDVRWVAFDGCGGEGLLDELGLVRPMVIKPDNNSVLKELYNKMFTTQKTDKIYGNYTCSGLIYQYITEFYRQSGISCSENGHHSLLVPVMDYIEENYSKDFPLTRLAEVAGVTPQHLCRVFKTVMHIRPNEYLTKRRLQEAKQLLRYSEISVNEISALSGFSDSSYFSTVFRKHEGVTPMEYRKRTIVS